MSRKEIEHTSARFYLQPNNLFHMNEILDFIEHQGLDNVYLRIIDPKTIEIFSKRIENDAEYIRRLEKELEQRG